MELKTTRDVIEALGGLKATATITGRTYDAVRNWVRFKHFPCKTYFVISEALARTPERHTASRALWEFQE